MLLPCIRLFEKQLSWIAIPFHNSVRFGCLKLKGQLPEVEESVGNGITNLRNHSCSGTVSPVLDVSWSHQVWNLWTGCASTLSGVSSRTESASVTEGVISAREDA